MSLVVTLLQILVTYGPAAYAAAIELAHKTDVTKEDFLALKTSISQETYDNFIADRRAERGLPAVSPLGA